MKSKLSSITRVGTDCHSIAILLPGFLDSNRYLKMKVFAKGLNKLGYATLQLDPCGLWYGEGTDKTYTVTGYLADIERALEAMLTEVSSPKDVLLLGHSMGAFLAIIAASKLNEVTSVCSLCPPDSLKRLSEKGDWKKTGLKTSTRQLPEDSTQIRTFILPYSFAEDMLQYEALDVIGSLKARLMIGISMKDEAVRVEATERLVSAAKNSHVVRFERMDHHFNNNLKDTEIVWRHIAGFLQQQVESGVS